MIKKEKSCGALVLKKTETGHELLLIKHKYGNHWAFPKGHVEEGESERQTALREVKEETGLDIKLIKGFRHAVRYSPKMNVDKLVVYFLGVAQPDQPVVMLESEISDFTWMDIENITQHLTYNNDKFLVGKALKYL